VKPAGWIRAAAENQQTNGATSLDGPHIRPRAEELLSPSGSSSVSKTKLIDAGRSEFFVHDGNDVAIYFGARVALDVNGLVQTSERRSFTWLVSLPWKPGYCRGRSCHRE